MFIFTYRSNLWRKQTTLTWFLWLENDTVVKEINVCTQNIYIFFFLQCRLFWVRTFISLTLNRQRSTEPKKLKVSHFTWHPTDAELTLPVKFLCINYLRAEWIMKYSEVNEISTVPAVQADLHLTVYVSRQGRCQLEAFVFPLSMSVWHCI